MGRSPERQSYSELQHRFSSSRAASSGSGVDRSGVERSRVVKIARNPSGGGTPEITRISDGEEEILRARQKVLERLGQRDGSSSRDGTRSRDFRAQSSKRDGGRLVSADWKQNEEDNEMRRRRQSPGHRSQEARPEPSMRRNSSQEPRPEPSMRRNSSQEPRPEPSMRRNSSQESLSGRYSPDRRRSPGRFQESGRSREGTRGSLSSLGKQTNREEDLLRRGSYETSVSGFRDVHVEQSRNSGSKRQTRSPPLPLPPPPPPPSMSPLPRPHSPLPPLPPLRNQVDKVLESHGFSAKKGKVLGEFLKPEVDMRGSSSRMAETDHEREKSKDKAEERKEKVEELQEVEEEESWLQVKYEDDDILKEVEDEVQKEEEDEEELVDYGEFEEGVVEVEGIQEELREVTEGLNDVDMEDGELLEEEYSQGKEEEPAKQLESKTRPETFPVKVEIVSGTHSEVSRGESKEYNGKETEDQKEGKRREEEQKKTDMERRREEKREGRSGDVASGGRNLPGKRAEELSREESRRHEVREAKRFRSLTNGNKGDGKNSDKGVHRQGEKVEEETTGKGRGEVVRREENDKVRGRNFGASKQGNDEESKFGGKRKIEAEDGQTKREVKVLKWREGEERVRSNRGIPKVEEKDFERIPGVDKNGRKVSSSEPKVSQVEALEEEIKEAPEEFPVAIRSKWGLVTKGKWDSEDEEDEEEGEMEEDAGGARRLGNEEVEEEEGEREGEDSVETSLSPSHGPPTTRCHVIDMLQSCRSVESFRQLDVLGEGVYGVVHRAKDESTGECWALKRVKLEKEREGFPLTSLREINILLAFDHPSVVKVKEVVVGGNMDRIFMVMEYMEHDLKGVLETMDSGSFFSISEVKCLMKQLLEGVQYLHANWVLHRDLKTSNLLVNNAGEIKICDFGLSRQYGDPLKAYTQPVVTLWYRSPELLLGQKEYSTPIDIWSLGCIMAEIMTKKPLFKGESEIDQLHRIFDMMGTPTADNWPEFFNLPASKKVKFEPKFFRLRELFPAMSVGGMPALSEAGFNLLKQMLTFDPDVRITAEAALKHPWFSEEPKPKAKSDMPKFPVLSEKERRRRRTQRSPDPLKEQQLREQKQAMSGTSGGLFG